MKQTTSKYSVLVSLAILALFVVASQAQYARELTHRIYMEQYFPHYSQKNVETCKTHLKQASAAGYNACLLIGPQDVGTIERWDAGKLNRYAQVVAEAKKYNIALVSQNFSAMTGVYGDPKIGEVSPVKGTPFKVSGGMARCASDHDIGLANGGFEAFANGYPTGWRHAGLHGSAKQDMAVKHGGKSSLKMSNIKANTYIFQRINLKPYRAYRITAWFKTQGLKTNRDVEFVVTGKTELFNRRWRSFDSPAAGGNFGLNMNWKKCTADFNSQNNTFAKIAFWFATDGYGAGGHGDGVIWIDDMVVEEVGLYETMRRKDCPVIVKSADGSKTYKEGKDYVLDSKQAKFTWQNCFYQGTMNIPAGSAIKNGDMLKVDWYKFSDNYLLYAETDFCIPETWTAMEDNIKRIDKLMGHAKWSFLNYDEWRSPYQSPHCPVAPTVKTGGEYLAATLWRTVKTCRSINNGKRELWVYNDMYDPYHNAQNVYGMAQGGTSGSWEGLDPSVIVINWRGLEKSYAFFMGLDPKRKGIVNRQVLFCQSGGEAGTKVAAIKRLESQGGSKKSMIGMVWCTWYNAYEHMTSTANAWKAAGWWGNKPLPDPGQSAPVPVPTKPYETAIKEEPVAAQPAIVSLPMRVGSRGIEYTLPHHARTDLRIVDLNGRTVKRLTGLQGKAGLNSVGWNSREMSAGVYFLQLKTDAGQTRQIKFTVL